MCGLVGMAGELTAKHDRVLKNLLMMDVVRGEDSTGVAFVPRFGEVKVAKQVGDPFVLFNHNSYNKGIAQVNRAMIGHNRYATVGGISRHTAHPFDFDTLVGAHNGTLASKWKLLDNTAFKVDSENLFHHIEQRGLQDALDQLGFHGNAWALVWWDKVNETLNFLRNKERTLYLVTSEDGKQMFWASESWMLHGALARNDIKYGDVTLLPEDTLLSVHINNKGELSKPVLRRHAAPIPVIQAVQQANSHQHKATKGEANPKKENVVVNITKALPAGTPEINGSVSSYLSRKNVTYEILSASRDEDGGEYLTLFDREHPYAEVRVYFRPQDAFLKDCLGEDVIGSVSTYIPYSQFPSRGFFKVSPWTIQLVTQPGQEGGDAVAADDEMDNLFPDANGKMVTEAKWKEKYGDCAYCSIPLDPADRNRFTTAGECLCPSCSKSEEALQYVNLV